MRKEEPRQRGSLSRRERRKELQRIKEKLRKRRLPMKLAQDWCFASRVAGIFLDIPHLKYKIYLNRADVIHRYFFLCLPKNQIAALGKTSVQNVELHCASLASLNVRCTAKSVLLIESSLSFMVFVSMIGALEVPFFGSQRWALLAKVPVFGPQKMALRVPKSKF